MTVQGEYSANMLREKILGEKVEQEEPAKLHLDHLSFVRVARIEVYFQY